MEFANTILRTALSEAFPYDFIHTHTHTHTHTLHQVHVYVLDYPN